VDELSVADLDLALARRAAGADPDGRARAERLDVTDFEALRAAARGRDAVVNATLPRFNGAVQRAAREAGAHYLDLAHAEGDPFADDALWRDAGRTALLGMGEDPGLSNVFARSAADGLDRVDAIRIRDGDTASSPDFPFVCLFSPETFVEETLHPSRVWEDGAYRVLPPFGGFETYAFPPPLGPLPVYSVDHEEVDTLPRFLGVPVRYVDFKLALDDGTVRVLRRAEEERVLDRGPGADPEARRAFFEAIPKPSDLAGRVDGFAALVVEVDGESNGRRVRRTVSTLLGHREAAARFGATATAYLTGTAGAIGTLRLLSGEVRETGVLPPERLDPAPFFPALEARGIAVDVRSEPDDAAR
jgi:saccharopine dehydrogenase (NAD+, L-lysine-forming)